MLTPFGTIAQSTLVLNSKVGSATRQRGRNCRRPIPGFTGTVKQALRPFPQYTRSEPSKARATTADTPLITPAMIRFEKRYTAWTDVPDLLCIFEDPDRRRQLLGQQRQPLLANGCCLAADQYNRRLEKSIGQFDVTHNFKIGFVYELPFGKGRQYLTHGPAAWVLGNWGVNGVLTYASGQPVGITSTYVLPLYAIRRPQHSVHHFL